MFLKPVTSFVTLVTLQVWRPCLYTVFNVRSYVIVIRDFEIVFINSFEDSFISANVDIAFAATMLHCMLGFGAFVKFTPRSFSSVTDCNATVVSSVCISYFVSYKCSMCIYCVFGIYYEQPFV